MLVTEEYQEQNIGVNVLLECHYRSDAKRFPCGTPCLMHYMQAHNCKLHYNDCSAFARHRCQSKYFLERRERWDTDFSVICRNKHFNNQHQKVTFFSLLPIHDSDRKDIVEKVKRATFFLVTEQGMKEQEGRGGSRTDRKRSVQPKNGEF